MSVICMTRVWEHCPDNGNAKLVLLAIADFADRYGVGWPSIKSIADMANVSERHVSRLTSKLQLSGQLAIFPRKREGTDSPTSNAYIVLCGLNRKAVRFCYRRIIELGGSLNYLGGISQLAPPDKMSPTYPGDIDVTTLPTATSLGDDGDVTTLVTQMSSDPSLIRQGTGSEPSDTGAIAPDEESKLARFFGMGVTAVSQQIADPTAGAAVESPADPAWANIWRQKVKIHWSHGFNIEHVIRLCLRLADDRNGAMTIPTQPKKANQWAKWCLELLIHFHDDLIQHKMPSEPEIDCRRACWAIDYFYWLERNGMGLHTAHSPGSFQNTVTHLSTTLRRIQEFYRLRDPHILPTESQIQSYHDQQKGKRGNGKPLQIDGEIRTGERVRDLERRVQEHRRRLEDDPEYAARAGLGDISG